MSFPKLPLMPRNGGETESPGVHTHTISDITGLQAALAALQPLDNLVLDLADEEIPNSSSLPLYSGTASNKIEGSVSSDVAVSLVWIEGDRYTTSVLAGRTVTFSYPQFGAPATLAIENGSGSTATVSVDVWERTRFD